MQDALMLGYVRQNRSLRTHLLPAMKKRRVELKVEELPQEIPTPDDGKLLCIEPLYRSRHRRGFLWPHGKGAAVDIFIYHSWHRCD
jgi:hypothetical protein